jgi:hypothetical protein
MRVISHQEEERGLPRGFAPPAIVREFCEWEILRPVVLLMVDEESEICLYPLVISFRLSIHSWVISGRDVLLYGEQATQLPCEPGREPWVSVAYYFGG